MNRRFTAGLVFACLATLCVSLPAEAKTYAVKQCRDDYRRLCPNTPKGLCDLATMIDQLSPACKTYVLENK